MLDRRSLLSVQLLWALSEMASFSGSVDLKLPGSSGANGRCSALLLPAEPSLYSFSLKRLFSLIICMCVRMTCLRDRPEEGVGSLGTAATEDL